MCEDEARAFGCFTNSYTLAEAKKKDDTQHT
jgi:hypothetical protein